MFVVFAAAFSSAQESSRADREQEEIVRDIVIDISGDKVHENKLDEIARNLIYLKKDRPFSPVLLQDSIDALVLSKKFSSISVDSKDVAGGMVVHFTLTPYRYVKRIDIHGESPVFESKILSQLTFYTGDAYEEAYLKEQAVLIERLYKDRGFIDPEVIVKPAIDPEDGNVAVVIEIEPGNYFKLENLVFSGNKSFSSGRLKSKTSVWRNSFVPGNRGRFIEKDLKKDVEKLVKFYRGKHYPEVEIGYEIERDTEKNEVSVRVEIREGPYYDIEFEGNEEFWDLTLGKDLVLFQDGNPRGLGLRKAIRKMKERYREKGYLETEIEIVEEGGNDDGEQKDVVANVRKIKLAIDEGPRSVVDSVDISGNLHLEEEQIRNQMLTREPGILHSGQYVPEVLDADTQAIKALYAQDGFADTEVKEDVRFPEDEISEDKKKAEVAVRVEEGPRTVVEKTEFVGLAAVSEQEAFEVVSLKPGEPFRGYMLKSDSNTVSSLISPLGYPHVTVEGRVSFSEDKSKASIVYHVDQGSFVKMGQIYYSGNFRTKEFVVSREVEMEPGEPFSLKKMLEAQKTIRDMDIFDSVKFKLVGLKEKAEDLHLFVEMHEKKPYYFQTGLGYRSDIGAYIDTKAGDRNFLGRNKHVWAGGSFSQVGYRAEAWYSEPRFLGSRFQNSTGVFAEKKEEFNQNFGVRLFGASVGFSRDWTSHLSTGLAFKYEKRDLYETDGTIIIDEDDEEKYRPRNIFVLTPSVSYDNRDSAIRPRKGCFASASADVSQGLDNDLDSFVKYNVDSRYFWTPKLFPRLTLAILGRAGYIDPLGDIDNLPDDQLLFLGGVNDVRGYKENMLLYDEQDDPLGGRSSVVGSLEARFDLGGDFELATFFDVGRVWETEVPVDDDGWRSSAGLGIRYITPIGPVGFLYGFKLDKRDGESPGRLHFSLGYTF